jgi:hypothetical protein
MMLALFLKLLPAALQCVDAGSRKPHHVAAALIAWALDLLIVRSYAWRWFAGERKKGEKTISDMLERLCVDVNNKDWPLYYGLARKINRISPTGYHIKAAIK